MATQLSVEQVKALAAAKPKEGYSTTQIIDLAKNQSSATPAPISTVIPGVVTPQNLPSVINQGNTKTSDVPTKSETVAVPTSTIAGSSATDLYAMLKSAATPTTPAPAAPDYTKAYDNLRATYNVDGLSQQLNDLTTQKRQIQESLQQQRNAERAKGVAMNVIEGRIGQEEQAANERIAALDTQIATANAQLTTANNIIETKMNLQKADYETAKASYDQEFTRNLSMIQSASSLANQARTESNVAQDNARANLQVIYNSITSGGSSVGELSAAQRQNITALELQAGLPSGFYASLQSKDPTSSVLSTTTRETGGAKYADVIMRAQDGSISTKSVYLGGASSSSSGATTDGALTYTKEELNAYKQLLQNGGVVDGTKYNPSGSKDGYSDPYLYNALYNKWIANGGTKAGFLKAFPPATYVNPKATNLPDFLMPKAGATSALESVIGA